MNRDINMNCWSSIFEPLAIWGFSFLSSVVNNDLLLLYSDKC